MMKRTTVAGVVLFTLLMAGSAIGSVPAIEPPGEALETGGVGGSAIGCDVQTENRRFVYGQPGVPSSGPGDDNCGIIHFYEEDILYTVLKSPGGSASTGANSIGWPPSERYVACDEPAIVLVDWTTKEPTPTYLLGGECTLNAFGDMTEQRWLGWGVASTDYKFVHTDNELDALVHLLS